MLAVTLDNNHRHLHSQQLSTSSLHFLRLQVTLHSFHLNTFHLTLSRVQTHTSLFLLLFDYVTQPVLSGFLGSG